MNDVRASGRVNWRELGLLAGMLVVALVFWDYLYPLKLFTVLLHETGHALAALVTGGSVDHIELDANLGGVCWSSGGLRLLVLPAGYLGSMLFGGLILLAAARTRLDRAISVAIGLLVFLVAILLVRNLFGLVVTTLTGIALFAMGTYLSEQTNDIVLKFIGLTSCMYAVFDIKDDLISRTVPGSDAVAMSKIIPLPPVVFGLLWAGIAIVCSVWFLWLAARKKATGQESSERS